MILVVLLYKTFNAFAFTWVCTSGKRLLCSRRKALASTTKRHSTSYRDKVTTVTHLKKCWFLSLFGSEESEFIVVFFLLF